jgi:Gram-negative porin
MKKHSLYALAAAGLLAGGLSVTSASAADLGGNCCADLEERIAELEATTARKGNRKVSLTVSGWVGQQVMYWDDGFESNTYVHDLGSTLASHVKFTGQAAISPGWSAGYVLQIEAIGSDALGISQDTPAANSLLSNSRRGVQVLQSYWFVKSETLGKLSVGLLSQASDNTAILVDGSGSLVPANFVAFDYGFFQARTSGSGANQGAWIGLLGCTDCNGAPLNAVRYDTPTFGGFSLSASWGEDDFWDVAGRYAGEAGGFKLAVAAAYSESTDGTPGTLVLQGENTQFFQVGAYIQHVPTGLFVYGAYGDRQVDGAQGNDFFYVKAGLRQRFNALGHTVLYGEYQDQTNDDATDSLGLATGFEGNVYGGGIVQEVDAAAMSVWLKYRNVSGEFQGVGPAVEDFDYVGGGALINF